MRLWMKSEAHLTYKSAGAIVYILGVICKTHVQRYTETEVLLFQLHLIEMTAFPFTV